MLDQFVENCRRNCSDIAAQKSGLCNVQGMSDTGCDYFSRKFVHGKDLDDFREYGIRVVADVVKTADEGAHIGSAGSGGQQSLVGGKDQGDIGLDVAFR